MVKTLPVEQLQALKKKLPSWLISVPKYLHPTCIPSLQQEKVNLSLQIPCSLKQQVRDHYTGRQFCRRKAVALKIGIVSQYQKHPHVTLAYGLTQNIWGIWKIPAHLMTWSLLYEVAVSVTIDNDTTVGRHCKRTGTIRYHRSGRWAYHHSVVGNEIAQTNNVLSRLFWRWYLAWLAMVAANTMYHCWYLPLTKHKRYNCWIKSLFTAWNRSNKSKITCAYGAGLKIYETP